MRLQLGLCLSGCPPHYDYVRCSSESALVLGASVYKLGSGLLCLWCPPVRVASCWTALALWSSGGHYVCSCPRKFVPCASVCFASSGWYSPVVIPVGGFVPPRVCVSRWVRTTLLFNRGGEMSPPQILEEHVLCPMLRERLRCVTHSKLCVSDPV